MTCCISLSQVLQLSISAFSSVTLLQILPRRHNRDGKCYKMRQFESLYFYRGYKTIRILLTWCFLHCLEGRLFDLPLSLWFHHSNISHVHEYGSFLPLVISILNCSLVALPSAHVLGIQCALLQQYLGEHILKAQNLKAVEFAVDYKVQMMSQDKQGLLTPHVQTQQM